MAILNHTLDYVTQIVPNLCKAINFAQAQESLLPTISSQAYSLAAILPSQPISID